MQDWQPIETAPHDTTVLLYCPNRGLANPERIYTGQASGGWWRHGVSTMHRDAWATHWMPLPAPPALNAAQRE